MLLLTLLLTLAATAAAALLLLLLLLMLQLLLLLLLLLLVPPMLTPTAELLWLASRDANSVAAALSWNKARGVKALWLASIDEGTDVGLAIGAVTDDDI